VPLTDTLEVKDVEGVQEAVTDGDAEALGVSVAEEVGVAEGLPLVVVVSVAEEVGVAEGLPLSEGV
jgi:hypothetical protein